jgi:hypothetical protein
MLNDNIVLEIHPYDGNQCNVGLANKLRAIISSIVYCQNNNYKLNVVWDLFYQLFPHIFSNDLFTKNPGNVVVNPMFYPIGEQNNKYGGFPGDETVDYYSKTFPFQKIFKSLIPSENITNKLEFYSKEFNIEECFGVHLRLGDFIKYSQENNYYLPTYEDYINKIDNLCESNNLFYFTSDDETSYLNIKNRYGNRVYFIENKNLNRKDENNFYDAYIDLKLLSKTKFILGNKFSTFSYHAARIGDKDLIYLEK